LAESFWSRAQGLEMIGQTSNARANLERAVLIMPELGQLERTWLLAGRIDLDEGLTTNATRFLRAERLAQAADWHAALDASRELRQTADDSTAVRRQAAQLFALAGLSEYRLGRLTAAYDAWRRGFEIDPARLDCPCYLGLVQARLDRTHPDESRRWIDLVLPRLGDRLLRADLLSSLGDAYFEAGQFAEARTFYRDSLRVYDLPKEINYRGRKGLLGM
jgi:tetratricopeptide (TPR) repeat protein